MTDKQFNSMIATLQARAEMTEARFNDEILGLGERLAVQLRESLDDATPEEFAALCVDKSFVIGPPERRVSLIHCGAYLAVSRAILAILKTAYEGK